MKSVANFLEGFLFGGLLGVALVLLFTPASGEELRGQLQSEVERIRSDVKQAASDRRNELEQQLTALRTPRTPG